MVILDGNVSCVGASSSSKIELVGGECIGVAGDSSSMSESLTRTITPSTTATPEISSSTTVSSSFSNVAVVTSVAVEEMTYPEVKRQTVTILTETKSQEKSWTMTPLFSASMLTWILVCLVIFGAIFGGCTTAVVYWLYTVARHRYTQLRTCPRSPEHIELEGIVFEGASGVDNQQANAITQEEGSSTGNTNRDDFKDVDLDNLPLPDEKIRAALSRSQLVPNIPTKVPYVGIRLHPYVKIYLLYKNQRIAKKKTHVKKRTLNPVFNESFAFDLPNPSALKEAFGIPASDANADQLMTICLDDISLEFLLLDWDRVTKNEVIGRLELGGPKCSGSALHHWKEVCNSPRRQIAEWHKLRELLDVSNLEVQNAVDQLCITGKKCATLLAGKLRNGISCASKRSNFNAQ
ncbi:unnamed protein product [Notodromas monacha]|uniref:C2 domain-containing protein n=1 Tax=Notodromas monacha TaxID=399045 RepID=A0A7R9GJI4_9CRUS|nr:unnamed protein product [Notodromas monacha]CAG0922854.1 unnamed protein product [Notodromas monacha]